MPTCLSDVVAELRWRGLIHQTTDNAGLAGWLLAKPRTLYAGFDICQPGGGGWRQPLSLTTSSRIKKKEKRKKKERKKKEKKRLLVSGFFVRA